MAAARCSLGLEEQRYHTPLAVDQNILSCSQNSAWHPHGKADVQADRQVLAEGEENTARRDVPCQTRDLAGLQLRALLEEKEGI